MKLGTTAVEGPQHEARSSGCIPELSSRFSKRYEPVATGHQRPGLIRAAPPGVGHNLAEERNWIDRVKPTGKMCHATGEQTSRRSAVPDGVCLKYTDSRRNTALERVPDSIPSVGWQNCKRARQSALIAPSTISKIPSCQSHRLDEAVSHSMFHDGLPGRRALAVTSKM